jgi:predicted enzyme related to lactoylglutathione lyase
MFEKVAFTMYPVENLKRARNFYETTLGLKHGKISAEGRWVEYDLPRGGCFCITDLVPELKPSASAASIAFEVEDIDKLVADLKAKNVSMKADIFHTPVCKMAVILDTEGNSVCLHQLNKK